MLSVVWLEECPAEGKKSRRAEPAASGREVASVAEGTPPRARVPGGRQLPPQGSPPAICDNVLHP